MSNKVPLRNRLEGKINISTCQSQRLRSCLRNLYVVISWYHSGYFKHSALYTLVLKEQRFKDYVLLNNIGLHTLISQGITAWKQSLRKNCKLHEFGRSNHIIPTLITLTIHVVTSPSLAAFFHWLSSKCLNIFTYGCCHTAMNRRNCVTQWHESKLLLGCVCQLYPTSSLL